MAIGFARFFGEFLLADLACDARPPTATAVYPQVSGGQTGSDP